MTTRPISSSWIESVGYLPYVKESRSNPPVAGTHGFLVLTSRTGTSYYYAVPSWVVGLLIAAHTKGQSVGRLYNKMVRGRWPSIKQESNH